MEFKEVVGRRRSIRFYQPWQPVEREKVQTILEAARLASRAVNAAFAKAIVAYRDQVSVEDRNALKTATTTAQIDTAPVYVFWYGDLEAVVKTDKGDTLRQLVNVGALNPPLGWSHRYVDEVIWPQVMEPMTQDRGQAAALARQEAGLAVFQALLCAVDEGLGTLLTAVNPRKAKELVDYPETWMPMSASAWSASGWAGSMRLPGSSSLRCRRVPATGRPPTAKPGCCSRKAPGSRPCPCSSAVPICAA